MHQKAIVFLVLLVNTSFALSTCVVLFVIDGSSYWPSFRGEMTSISTTGNLFYSSTAVYAFANFWLYGDGDQDQPIPNWFYSRKQDFLDNVAEVQSNQGKETIVGATAKLNRWQTNNAVIVLYTASPQNLISIAGYNYTEQYRTLAIHLNDGVDMSPISDYPSPQMSEFGNIVDLIVSACRQLPTEGPPTSEPITATASPSATPRPNPSQSTSFVPPGSSTAAYTEASISVASSQPAPTSSSAPNLRPCYGLFVIDGSNQVTGIEAYFELDYSFNANAWEYGNGPNNDPIPTTFIDSQSSFDDLVASLDTYNGNENANTCNRLTKPAKEFRAVEKLNAWTESEAIILLYTGSKQADVDQAAKTYRNKDSTLGISVDGQSDLKALTAVTADISDFPAIITALNYLCESKLGTVKGINKCWNNRNC